MDDGEASSSPSTASTSSSLSGAEDDDDTLRDALLGGGGFDADDGAGASTSGGGVLARLQRLWNAGAREACEDAAGDVAAWTRRGGALRALLVVSVSRAIDVAT